MLGQILVRVGADITDLTKGLQEGAKRMKSFGGDMSSAGSQIAGTFGVASGAIVGGLGAAVKTAADFDTAMRKAGAIAGASAEDLDAMRKSALHLGATTSQTSSSVATAMKEMAAKGYNATQIIAAMPGVISAAEASGEDLALAANTVSSALNIFGLEAGESGRVADILAKTANSTAASMNDMSLALKYAGAPANALGLSLEETAAAIGLMTNAGIDGSSAGTALRASLLALNNPASEQAKTMEKLGVSLYDSGGKMKSISGIVGELTRATEGMTEAQKTATLAKLVGTEAVSGFLALMNAGPAKIDKMTASLENSAGASAKTAAEMKAGIGGAIEGMASAIETLAITVGDQLVPYVQKAANFIGNLANAFNNASPKVQKAITFVGVLAGAITGLIAVGGTLAFMIGNIISAFGAISSVMATLITAFSAGGAAASALGAVFTVLTGPIGIAIAAIAAIIAVLVLMYKKCEWFRNMVNDTWEKLKKLTSDAFASIKGYIVDFIGGAVSFAKGILDKFKAFWEENGSAITKIVQLYFGQIKTHIEIVMYALKGIFDAVLPVIASVVNITFSTMKLTIGSAIDAILGVVQAGLKLLQGDWKGAWSTIKTTSQKLVSNIKQYFENIDLIETGKNIIRGFIKGFESASNGISASVSNFTDQIKDTFGAKFKALKTTVEKKFEELKTSIVNWFTSMPGVIETKLTEWGAAIETWFTNLSITITSKLEEWWTAISDWFSSVPDRIKGKLVEWGTAISNWTDEQNEENKRQFGEWWNTMSDWFSSVHGKIGDKLLEWGTAISNWFKSIPGVIADKLTEWGNAISNGFTSISGMISTKLSEWRDNISNWFKSMPGVISTKLSEWWNTISKWFSQSYNGITTKLSEWSKAIGKWFSDMPSNIGNWLENWWSKISTWFSEIPGRITAKLEEWWKAIKSWFEATPNKPEVKDMGKKMIDKVSEGTTEKKSELLDNLGKIIVDVALGALAFAGVALVAAGREIILRLIKGIQAAKASLGAKLDEIKNTIINKMKGISLTQIGKDIVRGLISGISSMFGAVQKKISELASKIPDWAKSKLGIHSPSRVLRDEVGKWIPAGLAAGIMKNLGQVRTAADHMSAASLPDFRQHLSIEEKYRKAVQSLMSRTKTDKIKALEEYVDAQKSANNMTLKQEAEFWRYSATGFKNGTKEKAAALEAFNKAQSALRKQQFEEEKAFIEMRKNFNNMSLREEVIAYNHYMKNYKVGSEEYLYYAKEAFDTRKAIADKLVAVNEDFVSRSKKINDDLIANEQAATKAYEDAVQSRFESIKNSMGIFDKVKEQERVESATLTQNLSEQVAALSNWQTQLALLSQRGVTGDLFEELSRLGVGATAQLEALNRMTDTELTQYQELFAKKSEIARAAAIRELEPLKEQTAAQIQAMREEANKELASLQKDWQTQVEQVVNGTEKGFATLKDVGVYAIQGLRDGMLSMKGELSDAAGKLASIIENTIRSSLAIKSPSRLLKALGGYAGEGLAIGLEDMERDVEKSAAILARAAQPNIDPIDFGGYTTDATSKIETQLQAQFKAEAESRQGDFVLQVDGYELARVQKDHIGGMMRRDTSLRTAIRGV